MQLGLVEAPHHAHRQHRGEGFPRSAPAPDPGSRHLRAGHRLARTAGTRQTHPGARSRPRFRCHPHANQPQRIAVKPAQSNQACRNIRQHRTHITNSPIPRYKPSCRHSGPGPLRSSKFRRTHVVHCVQHICEKLNLCIHVLWTGFIDIAIRRGCDQVIRHGHMPNPGYACRVERITKSGKMATGQGYSRITAVTKRIQQHAGDR